VIELENSMCGMFGCGEDGFALWAPGDISMSHACMHRKHCLSAVSGRAFVDE